MILILVVTIIFKWCSIAMFLVCKIIESILIMAVLVRVLVPIMLIWSTILTRERNLLRATKCMMLIKTHLAYKYKSVNL